MALFFDDLDAAEVLELTGREIWYSIKGQHGNGCPDRVIWSQTAQRLVQSTYQHSYERDNPNEHNRKIDANGRYKK